MTQSYLQPLHADFKFTICPPICLPGSITSFLTSRRRGIATILSKKSGRSKAAHHLKMKSATSAQNNKVSEPRLFSVAIISLGTDADEVITEALP